MKIKKMDLSAISIVGVCAVLLALISFCEAGNVKTDPPLKCHVCDPETCKAWTKKSEPKECNVNDLYVENIGPTKLSNFSFIPFSPLGNKEPEFVCQKIEAYDTRGMSINVVRKCQLKLPGNESCSNFYKNLEKDRTYTNATCHVCFDHNGCNSCGLIYVWAPLLLSSIILCLLIK